MYVFNPWAGYYKLSENGVNINRVDTKMYENLLKGTKKCTTADNEVLKPKNQNQIIKRDID